MGSCSRLWRHQWDRTVICQLICQGDKGFWDADIIGGIDVRVVVLELGHLLSTVVASTKQIVFVIIIYESGLVVLRGELGGIFA